MFTRDITKKVRALAKQFPVIALLGPRQSGKTTLSRLLFNKHIYLTLEDLDIAEFATNDPRGFFEKYKNSHGIILDEIQNTPELLSYIQGYVDKEKKDGYFIITGSQNFLLNESITQTLAGRIALCTLLPLSVHELQQNEILMHNIESLLFKGSYPAVYSKKISPLDLFPNYIRTYIERDVRQLKQVHDVSLFQRFIKLCAGRIGQLLNLSALGDECGISSVTVRSWLSLLEQSYIIFLLQPHHKNFNKRLVKASKLYFYDTGLACSLLGIESEDQLWTHYLRGGLFESLILSDLMKQRYNQGRLPSIYFWRDKMGHEMDCIIEKASKLIPVEIKSGKTITNEFFDNLKYWYELTKSKNKGFVVYAGNDNQKRSIGTVMSWNSAYKILDK